ncbi:hypothetical protein Q5O14_16365 [Eubacteriaceae bacterium ES2]|nr:hypothetical protein Q5O14_16365 [Eubacteriaceae bacterium ES2]
MKSKLWKKDREKLKKQFGSYGKRRIEIVNEYEGYSIAELKEERILLNMELEMSRSDSINENVGVIIGVLGVLLSISGIVQDEAIKSSLIYFSLVLSLVLIGTTLRKEKMQRLEAIVNNNYQMRIDYIDEELKKRSK